MILNRNNFIQQNNKYYILLNYKLRNKQKIVNMIFWDDLPRMVLQNNYIPTYLPTYLPTHLPTHTHA